MAEALVLLPGMMCDARLYQPQVEHFSPQRDVIVVDFGTANTITDMAARVLQQAPEQFALAGLSMGGIVAMEVMRLAPERITRLALLDTNPRAEVPEVQAARQPQMDAAKAGKLEQVMREQMIARYFACNTDASQLTEDAVSMALDLGVDVFIAQSQALAARPDQQDTLAKVKVPTLILMGAEDQLCPQDRHDRMAELIPHATYTVIPDAGHIPCLEQPQLTNQALHSWLAQ